jgi:hypothetical protein
MDDFHGVKRETGSACILRFYVVSVRWPVVTTVSASHSLSPISTMGPLAALEGKKD